MLFSVTVNVPAPFELTFRPLVPVICPVRLTEAAPAASELKRASAKFAVIVPAKALPAVSMRIPGKSFPSAVLKTIALSTVLLPTVSNNMPAWSAGPWPIVIGPVPNGLLTIAPGAPTVVTAALIRRRVPIAPVVLSNVTPPENVLGSESAKVAAGGSLLETAIATCCVAPSATRLLIAVWELVSVSVETPVPALLSVIKFVAALDVISATVTLFPLRSNTPVDDMTSALVVGNAPAMPEPQRAAADRRIACVSVDGVQREDSRSRLGERTADARQRRAETDIHAVGIDAERLAGGIAEAAGIVGRVVRRVAERAAAETDRGGGRCGQGGGRVERQLSAVQDRAAGIGIDSREREYAGADLNEPAPRVAAQAAGVADRAGVGRRCSVGSDRQRAAAESDRAPSDPRE